VHLFLSANLQGANEPCTSEYVVHTNWMAHGASYKPVLATLEACKYACKYTIAACVAAQWRQVSSSCYLVFKLNDYYARFPTDGVDLYYLSTTCVVSTRECMVEIWRLVTF